MLSVTAAKETGQRLTRGRHNEQLKIPDGLRELSSDIIREVLRHQPEHLNGFIADYLETMLIVRENARDSGVVICDTFRQGYFFEELAKFKNISREQANHYATTIQAAWKGYTVRKKIGEWLKKKKKFEEEKEIRRSIRIEELLAGLGITYEEATRAAGIIQAAYKEAKRGKWISGEFGEFWVGESVPFGQRIREGDRAQGRFDRWQKEDFGDFFEMDDTGAIKYVWPKFGQVRKVLRENVPKDVPIIEFFAMRDLSGEEQYSYLIKTRPNTEVRGSPLGFLVPKLKSSLADTTCEVQFVDKENIERMGSYTFLYRDDVNREDLETFEKALKNQMASSKKENEPADELDYDPDWVLPRVLIRIKKELLLETDDEVKFTSLPDRVLCETEVFTFRAESKSQTLKIIRHILRDKCLTVAEGLEEAANMSPYKFQETGRIFPVEDFLTPKYIQKLKILPESSTGEEESLDILTYEYIFLPMHYTRDKLLPKAKPLLTIPITRFQGFHSDYKGSQALDNKVFIMGPKITTPDGRPFTYESLFWEEFGPEAWYQLLYNIATQESTAEDEEIFGEEVEEVLGEEHVAEEASEKAKVGYRMDEKVSDQDEVTESGATLPVTVAEAPTEATMEHVTEAEGEVKLELGEQVKEGELEGEPEPEPEPEAEPEKDEEKEPEKGPEATED